MYTRAKVKMRTAFEPETRLKDVSLPLFVATNVNVRKNLKNRQGVLELLEEVLGPGANLDRVHFSTESKQVEKIIEERYRESQRGDIWGAVDQVVSVLADDFMGSPQSTFAMFI